MDQKTSHQRSLNMQAVKSSGSKEEQLLMKTLYHRGHRYRKNNPKIFGKPDLTFAKYKLAIFVDSEFFHGKDFETKKKPVNNANFWQKKIARNIERDKEVNAFLTANGWTVLRFWSTEIKKNLDSVIDKIESTIIEIRTRKYRIDDDNEMSIAAEP
ncbi:very short patch repair endonuclease [Flavobacterium selenitireducens]|uniref:very short patch repair endonuclease n=1 Tax=Flavobacterium selenitireducens TaxID=2722704 RepID=UPI00168BA4CD|nr:very short patch repair endonuclease [Flavobacterium selenitireducens]MBD3581712.1 very short patch repair endonuclease [Flavobacterium selenitireducens]